MSDKKTVLLAEDELTTQKVMASSLEEEGIEVLVASDGEEALKLALEHHPDLILLDIQMPKMDGLTMLEKMRQDNWGKNADVILLTNFGDSDKISKAIRHKAFSYLMKSEYDTETIVQKVKEKLNLD